MRIGVRAAMWLGTLDCSSISSAEGNEACSAPSLNVPFQVAAGSGEDDSTSAGRAEPMRQGAAWVATSSGSGPPRRPTQGRMCYTRVEGCSPKVVQERQKSALPDRPISSVPRAGYESQEFHSRCALLEKTRSATGDSWWSSLNIHYAKPGERVQRISQSCPEFPILVLVRFSSFTIAGQ